MGFSSELLPSHLRVVPIITCKHTHVYYNLVYSICAKIQKECTYLIAAAAVGVRGKAVYAALSYLSGVPLWSFRLM